MIPQSVLVDLVSASYDPIRPDTFEPILFSGDAVACLKQIDDTLTISIPGTENLANVMTDIDIERFDHPVLGSLHAGFWRPIQGMGEALLPKLKEAKKISIAGHSEGAARAALLAAWCYLNGIQVDQLSLYACPRPGFLKLSIILQSHVENALSFHNGIDPVPSVPLFPYNDPLPKIRLGMAPGGLDDIDPVAWHSMNLYRLGVTQWEQTK